MSLHQRVNEDMKQAMRARDADRLSAIRMLLAAIKQKEIDERGQRGGSVDGPDAQAGITIDDATVIGVVDKLVKQRRDSVSQYQQAGREDLAARERSEIEILSAYLPQQASEDEIAREIDAAIADTGATGPQDMGKIMGVLKSRLVGRADLGRISAGVRARLAGTSA